MKLLSIFSIAFVFAASALSVAAAPPVQAEGAIRWLRGQVAVGNLVTTLPDHFGVTGSAWQDFLQTRGPAIIESHYTGLPPSAAVAQGKDNLLRISRLEDSIFNVVDKPRAKRAAEQLVQTFAAANSEAGRSLRLGRG